MKHRYMIGSAVAVGVLVASAVPAHAVSIVTKTDQKTMEIFVNTCPANAAVGTSCTKFTIEASWMKTEAGVVQNIVSVDAYNGTKQINGSVSGPKVSQGTVGQQTITVDEKAKSGRLSFTVTLTCNSPPCDFGGVYKFSLTLKKSAASEHSYTAIATETSDESCTASSSTRAGSTVLPTVGGTVKHAGSTQALRGATGGSSSMARLQTSTREVGACP